ncbi:MAG TPA: FecR family protein, partial [Phycisphaerae bacterium]|nr:FecR family protein [Phycisphaerae bacterium]
QQLALRIWDRHEVRLEPGTRLTPHWGQDGGCLLRLSAGQIRVAVNRTADEGIFRIVTPHADIAVTGTIFTVTATGSTTYLHVKQGSVEMTPQHGHGRLVSAGAVVSTQGLGVAAVPSDDIVTVLAAAESTVDLTEAIKESQWYRQRFAPLLYLQDYLAARGVDVDDLELLAISADLWCLQYPTDAGADLPAYIHRKEGLERTAQWCGYRAEWLTPSSTAEAAALVADGIHAGDLMLAYGLNGQAVTVLGPQGSADPAAEWQYRFLAEPTPTAFAICRIGPSERPPRRGQLLDQTVADVRSLLAETHDREYWVGREAIESWSQACGRTNHLRLTDPLLRSLTTIAHLAPVCEGRLSGSVMVGRQLGWTAAASGLADAVQSAFAASAFEATRCSQMQQEQLAGNLLSAVDRLAEETLK